MGAGGVCSMGHVFGVAVYYLHTILLGHTVLLLLLLLCITRQPCCTHNPLTYRGYAACDTTSVLTTVPIPGDPIIIPVVTITC